MGRTAHDNTDQDLPDDENHPNLTMMPKTIGAVDDGSDLVDDEFDEEDEPDELDALRQTVETLQSQSKEEREFHRSIMQQMLQTQQQGGQQGGQSDELINFDDLPDPVEKRAEFNKALGEKMQNLVNNTQQQLTQQTSTQQSMIDLENRFKTKYSDLADKQILLSAAVQQEAADMRNRGIDPQQSILADRDGFVDRIAGRMKKELGIDEGDGQMQRQQQRQQQRQSKRTKGVSAGSSSARGKRSKNKGEEKPTSFMDQMKKNQLDMGII